MKKEVIKSIYDWIDDGSEKYRCFFNGVHIQKESSTGKLSDFSRLDKAQTWLQGYVEAYTEINPDEDIEFYVQPPKSKGKKKNMSYLLQIVNNDISVGSGESSTVSKSPKMSNIHIKESFKNRVYFDTTTKLISGSTFDDFEIRGVTITGLTTVTGQTTGHYFTVSTDFNYWDNNSIRYTAATSDVIGEGSLIMHPFTLTHIVNQITEPVGSGTEYYVTTSGNNGNDGLSEVNAWATATYAATQVSAGDKVWIKAGNYGAENITAPSAIGTVSNPIVFEGYKTTIGDIITNYYVPYDNESDVTSADLSSVEMPLFDGGDTDAGGIGFELREPFPLTDRAFLIVKNIQFTNYQHGVATRTSAKDVIFERVNVKEVGSLTQTDAYCFQLSNFDYSNERFRLLNCIAVNGAESQLEFRNQHGLVDGFESYSDREDGDYLFGISGSDNIIKNSLARNKSNQGFSGHGFSVKYISEYNLFDSNLAINVENSFVARHNTANYNVFKDSEAHGNVPVQANGVYGITLYGGSIGNIFERMNLHDLRRGIFIVNNGEGVSSMPQETIIRNNLFDGVSDMFARITNNLAGAVSFTNNKIYHNTINDVSEEMFQLGFTDNGTITMSGNEVKNNIFNDLRDVDYQVTTGFRAPTTGEMSFEYNNTWDVAFGTNGVAESGTGNISVDPLLVSGVATNELLKVGTPTTTKTDYLGETRASIPTIGAHEIGGAVIPTYTVSNTDGTADYSSLTALFAGETIVAGDIIGLKGGDTFTENFSQTLVGSSGNNILITSYGTGQGTIRQNGENTLFPEANYVTLGNIGYDNSLADHTSNNRDYRIFSGCSNIIMRNMTLNLMVRPTRISALSSTGLLENITIEDNTFLSAGVGSEPTLTINEDATSYDMNILIQNNTFEGGEHFWGEDGDNPDFATIDVSGTGVTIIYNTVQNSQYAAAINLEDSDGDTQSVIAYNTINLNNVTGTGGNGAVFMGILIGKSTNVHVHHNTITGTPQIRGLISGGIYVSVSTNNVGDVIVEDNIISNVDDGIALQYVGSTVMGNYNYEFNRNTISDVNTFIEQDIHDGGTNTVTYDANIFRPDDNLVNSIRLRVLSGTNNTTTTITNTDVDLINRTTNYIEQFVTSDSTADYVIGAGNEYSNQGGLTVTPIVPTTPTQPANDIAWSNSPESKYNETQTISGWSSSRATQTADTDATEGTWSLKSATNSITSGSHTERNINVIAGKSYQFTFDTKYFRGGTVDSTPRIYFDTANNTGNRVIIVMDTLTSWTPQSFTLNAGAYTGSIEIRLQESAGSGDVDGNAIFIDNLQILEN